ncbi:ABC transporter permease [Clostridium sp.]|uniref:ABC transporter permease n=1 Tax=Clostridium sp. TaxID=1506 RepID=UPI0026068223|nr:ABC transporter permease [Clostridium sp.]
MNAIIKLTFLEMFKKKIIICIAMTIGFLALYGIALHYVYNSLGQMNVMMRAAISSQFISLGMYVSGFIIAFLSIFASVGAISYEIEQGNYLAVLSKPIHRFEMVLGRWLGIILMLLLYVTILFGCIIGLNVIMGKGFTFQFTFLALIKSLLMLYLLPLTLSSLGIFLSTCMSTVGAGILIVILYFCGMIGGIIEQIGKVIEVSSLKEILTNIGIITSLVMPSDTVYRKASSLLFTTSSGLNLNLEMAIGKSVEPSNIMIFYIVVYTLVFLIIAIRKFNKRDL